MYFIIVARLTRSRGRTNNVAYTHMCLRIHKRRMCTIHTGTLFAVERRTKSASLRCPFSILVHRRPANDALVLLRQSLRAVEANQSRLAGNRWPTNPVALSRHRRRLLRTAKHFASRINIPTKSRRRSLSHFVARFLLLCPTRRCSPLVLPPPERPGSWQPVARRLLSFALLPKPPENRRTRITDQTRGHTAG